MQNSVLCLRLSGKKNQQKQNNNDTRTKNKQKNKQKTQTNKQTEYYVTLNMKEDTTCFRCAETIYVRRATAQMTLFFQFFKNCSCVYQVNF